MPIGPNHLALRDLDFDVGVFAAWRKVFAGVFDIGIAPDEVWAFDGDVHLWSTGHFVLSTARCSRIRLIRTHESFASDLIDSFGIRLFVSGGAICVAGRVNVEVQTGDVILIDLSQTLTLQSSPLGGETRDVTLWIPRARLLASVNEEHAIHGLLLKGGSPTGALVGASLATLGAQASRMQVSEMDALASGVLELSARAISHSLETAADSRSLAPLASFVTIRRFIDNNLASPTLDAEMIAASFGLSRASLYRLFEPIGGVAGYVRKSRLERAYQEITSAGLLNRRIGPIAYRLGFKNVSAFGRTFYDAYGMSPTEARRAALKKMGGPQPILETPGNASLGRWLMQLTP